MAKKRGKSTGKLSSGKTKEIRKAKEAKRQAKLAKRREAGKGYEYKPIPYKKGSAEYKKEKKARALKNVSHKTEFQRYRSLFAKLDNK